MDDREIYITMCVYLCHCSVQLNVVKTICFIFYHDKKNIKNKTHKKKLPIQFLLASGADALQENKGNPRKQFCL